MNLSCQHLRSNNHTNAGGPCTVSSNSTNETAHLNITASGTLTWGILFVLGVVIMVTILANLLVIVLPVINKELRTPFNFLIVNIAIGDGLIGAFDMPQYVASYVYFGYWPYSQHQCTFWLLIDFLIPSVNLCSMAALSFDRLWAVSYPAVYRTHNTKRKAAIFITATWVASLAAILPGFTYSRLYFSAQSGARSCAWDVEGLPDWASSLYSMIVMVWLPFLVTLLCYVGTVFKLAQARLSRSAIAPTGPGDRRATFVRRMLKRTHRERQAFYVVTFLVVVLFVTYTPWVVYLIRLNWLKYTDSTLFYHVASWMGYALSTINPFMCFAGSRDMKNALKRALGWRRRFPVLDQPSTSKRATTGGRISTIRETTL